MDSLNKWFLDPLTNQFFDFEGRATRQQYWMFILWSILAVFGTAFVSAVVGLSETVGMLLLLALWVPQIAFGARRLHDLGKSGWWQLISLVPFIGSIILFVFLVCQGKTGPNQYGADPRASAPYPAEAVPPIPTPNPTSDFDSKPPVG